MPRLLVKLPGGTRTVTLGDEAVTVGRTSDNKLPIDDVGVSRRHAQILQVGKGWEVVDLGSRNGTKVNGKKVPRALLKGGDVLSFGDVEVVFEEEGAAGLELEELDLGGAAARAPSGEEAPATMELGAPGGAPPGECLLRFVAGERQGSELPLKGTRTTFGRRSANTVTFHDSAVSGVHCEITREANGYVLRDLGSTNGTSVEGEPVVETLLRHNARIRIGAQRMVFVDPSVADIESALTAGDEIAEWGLMRGEIDAATHGGRGGKGALLLAAVVIVAAAGGAWFVVSGAPRTVEVPPLKDNMVADWSMESGIRLWTSPDEDGARASVEGTPEKPRGASGAHCLEVDPRGAAAAVVEFSTEALGKAAFDVLAEASYELSAKVGSGAGAVVVTWISDSRPGLVREDSTPRVEGGPDWKETRVVATAPAHATGARVALVAFGGKASFDDVVFRRTDAGALPPLDAGEVRMRLDACGSLEVVRVGEVLLTEGGVAPSADAPPASLYGTALDAPPAVAGTALSAKGRLPDGTAFENRVESVAGGFSIACAAKSGSGAFAFTCPAGLARGAVTLVMEKTVDVVPEEETFRREGVRKIIVGAFGGPTPFVLSAAPGSPGFAFTCRRTPRGLRVQLAPPSPAPAGVDGVVVTLGADLSEEEGGARELMVQAKDLESRGRKGEAAEVYGKVAMAYHYLPAYRDPAAKAQEALLADAKARLREAERAFLAGHRFRSAPDLSLALEACGRIAAEYDGLPQAAEAKARAEAARAELAKVEAASLETRVERLYARARNYQEEKQPALAWILFEEIVRIAPEGDEVRKAVEPLLEPLRAEVEQRKTALFGPPRKR
jgi:pSer/pThr/pTyr-binding forkhead associated (FHA) protein